MDLYLYIIPSHDAIFFNHGQNCCAGSRTFVQEGIYDEFVAKAKAKAMERRVGDPWGEKVQQGPLVKHTFNLCALDPSK